MHMAPALTALATQTGRLLGHSSLLPMHTTTKVIYSSLLDLVFHAYVQLWYRLVTSLTQALFLALHFEEKEPDRLSQTNASVEVSALSSWLWGRGKGIPCGFRGVGGPQLCRQGSLKPDG